MTRLKISIFFISNWSQIEFTKRFDFHHKNAP